MKRKFSNLDDYDYNLESDSIEEKTEKATEKKMNVSRADPIVDETKGGTHHLNFLKKWKI